MPFIGFQLSQMKYAKITMVYLGGLLTGLALILYPSVGPILTDTGSEGFGFSSDQFGNLFIPQTVFAIISALSSPFLAKVFGIKKILLFGAIALLVSMLLLYFSHFLILQKTEAWMLLLVGTTFLGTGFGMIITGLNPIAFALFPNNKVASVAALHFFLGLGTAGAPLLLGLVQKGGSWFNLPLVVAGALLLFVVLVMFLSFESNKTLLSPKGIKVPTGLWLFVGIVTLYGVCEGTFGSFGSVFLKSQGLNVAQASLGLALFWAGLAFGRIFFSLVSLKLNLNWFYMVSLVVVGILLYLIPSIKGAGLNIAAMALSGFFMSSIFPRSVSWATETFKDNAVVASGLMVASLQFGTGISTNFLGIVSKTQSFALLFKIIAGVAIIAFVLIIFASKKFPQNNTT